MNKRFKFKFLIAACLLTVLAACGGTPSAPVVEVAATDSAKSSTESAIEAPVQATTAALHPAASPTVVALAVNPTNAPNAAPTVAPPTAVPVGSVLDGFTLIERLDCTQSDVASPVFSVVYPTDFTKTTCADKKGEFLKLARYSDVAKKELVSSVGFGWLGAVSTPDNYKFVASQTLENLIKTEKAQGYQVQVITQEPLSGGDTPVYRVDMIIDVGKAKEIFRAVTVADLSHDKGLIIYWLEVLPNPTPASFAEFDSGAFTTVLESIAFQDVSTPTPAPTAAPVVANTPAPTLASNAGFSRYVQGECAYLPLKGFSLLYPNEFEVGTCKSLLIYYASFLRYKNETDRSTANLAEVFLIASFVVDAPFAINYPKVVAGMVETQSAKVQVVSRERLSYKGETIERLDTIGADQKTMNRYVFVPSEETNMGLFIIWSKNIDNPAPTSFKEFDTGAFRTVLDSLDLVSMTRSVPSAALTLTPAPTTTPKPTLAPATAVSTPAAVGVLSNTIPPTFGELIYKNDLSKASPEFPDRREGNLVAYYPGPILRVGLKHSAAYRQLIGQTDLTDVSVNVSVVKFAGPLTASYGTICRAQDAKNYYGADVSEDGRMVIYAEVNGTYKKLSERTGINNGLKPLKQENHLRMDCIGDKLTVYVNDQLVAEAEDDRFTSGDVGIFAFGPFEGDVDLRFFDFQVRAP